VAELGLGEEWIGKGNLEVQTGPVLHLRETATKMGLLRKHGGMLLVTSRGRALRGDPARLWWHPGNGHTNLECAPLAEIMDHSHLVPEARSLGAHRRAGNGR